MTKRSLQDRLGRHLCWQLISSVGWRTVGRRIVRIGAAATTAVAVQETGTCSGRVLGQRFVEQRVDGGIEDGEEDERAFYHPNGRRHFWYQMGHGQDDEDPVGNAADEEDGHQTEQRHGDLLLVFGLLVGCRPVTHGPAVPQEEADARV